MSQEIDPWADTAPPDFSQIRIQFDPDDAAKTMSLEWVDEIVKRIFKARPATFNNKFADLYGDWVSGKFKAGPP